MNQNTKKLTLNTILSIALTILLAGLLIFEIASMIYGGICFDLTGETRMSTKVIDDLIHGINPYGTAWLSDPDSLPPIYYESGFFHLLPSVLVGIIFPCSTFVAATSVHCLYVIAALLLMFFLIHKITKNVNLGLIATNIFFFCLNVSVVTNVRPDTLCSLCIVLILLLIYWDTDYFNETKQKLSFHAAFREWIVAFLCVMLLFLKIHYASIIFALFFVYLKRKRLISIIVKGGIIGIITLALTQICFPTFFSTFIVRVIEMFTINNNLNDVTLMWTRWWELFRQFPALFIIIIVGIIINAKKYKSLWTNDFYLLLTINIAFNIVALCFMGKWPGNGIIYHETMIMSSIIVASMMFVSNFNKKFEKFSFILELCIAIISVFFIYKFQTDISTRFDYIPARIESKKNEFAELDKYKSEHMLLAPQKAFYTFANGIYQWDYGDQIYLPRDIGTSPRWNFLFPYTNEYRRRNVEYGNKMIEMINNKEYSLIITDTYNILGLKIGLEGAFQEAIENNYEYLKDEGRLTYWVPME